MVCKKTAAILVVPTIVASIVFVVSLKRSVVGQKSQYTTKHCEQRLWDDEEAKLTSA